MHTVHGFFKSLLGLLYCFHYTHYSYTLLSLSCCILLCQLPFKGPAILDLINPLTVIWGLFDSDISTIYFAPSSFNLGRLKSCGCNSVDSTSFPLSCFGICFAYQLTKHLFKQAYWLICMSIGWRRLVVLASKRQTWMWLASRGCLQTWLSDPWKAGVSSVNQSWVWLI